MNREEKEEVTFYGGKTGLQQEDIALEPTEPFDPKNIKIS